MELAGRRILFTGGGGMIGANLVRHVLGEGGRVFVAARSTGCPPNLSEVAGRIECLAADVRDTAAVQRAVDVAQPEIVVHLAATAFNPPPAASDHVDVNVRGTANLLQALSGHKGVRFIQAGSAAQYGDGDGLREDAPERPANWLGMTKSAAALLVHGAGRLHGWRTIELRLFTPFGPWEGRHRLIPHVILSALAGERVGIRNPRPERDFVYIGDVVRAFHGAMTRDVPSGSTINIGSGQGRSVGQVAAEILALMGRPDDLSIQPSEPRADEIWRCSADTTRAREMLDWRPEVPFSEALRRTIDWFTNAPQHTSSMRS
jgi:UDP-glucose 4-epimerase